MVYYYPFKAEVSLICHNYSRKDETLEFITAKGFMVY